MSQRAVRWPSVCDLCEEHTTTPERCSHCGHSLRPLDRTPKDVLLPPAVTFRPFADAVADQRARHRAALADLAGWSLSQGRSVDLDVAGLCIDVLEQERTDGGIHLDRRRVNGILWGSIHNEASMAGTSLPDQWIEDLWAVLRFLVATGRLTADSDPEAALLEPLQCYGGLDADGHPRPEGVDVDFFCQCHHPHDPSCSPGMAQISVGWDRAEPFEFVAIGHGVPRSVDVPMSAYEPLAKFGRRCRAQPSMFPVFLDQFQHLGTVPPGRSTPMLWLYLFTASTRKGWSPLALDEHGGAWRPKRHRGRRRGFRWVAVDDRSAAHLCGLASWHFERTQRERELLERWADPDDVPLRSV